MSKVRSRACFGSKTVMSNGRSFATSAPAGHGSIKPRRRPRCGNAAAVEVAPVHLGATFVDLVVIGSASAPYRLFLVSVVPV